MGVLNVTPDSFSDGSELSQSDSSAFAIDVPKALRRAEAMVAAGASIIDVGGESTRPGADAVSVDEELTRVIPVVEALRRNIDVCISVDTSTAQVMREAIAAGAELINDVRSLSCPEALQVVAESSAAVCLMHMQGQPRTMQKSFHYDDVVAEVYAFLDSRVERCIESGITRERLVVDPGFGFGKSVQHNFRLLRDLERFRELGLPVLAGLSRKSMIGAVTGRPVEARLAGSLGAAALALARGASVIRTHDVAATIDLIRVHCACWEA